jgi:addiction module HigA family antidote
MSKRAKRQPPVHPGEILREEFMKEYGLSANKLALHMGVPATHVLDLVHERRGITAGTAMRLGRVFGTTPEFWLNLQRDYELDLVDDVKIGAEVRPLDSRGKAASD